MSNSYNSTTNFALKMRGYGLKSIFDQNCYQSVTNQLIHYFGIRVMES